ncbi:FecR family protein [Chitinophaga terrae (ex Kim and Jung 2007)]|uniref:FecR family protein n=1 Tax=Chitinophaga terrae (ex Kim and Jung 2007) TaxID=408074 RepID=A0A1H4D461_9BACT|nr:FecR family protein [Chitinophaga terrae (ex Kim and Jung 2007)]SEA67378.1 FecR family protein [Chitinophaga terrae (ex Kim and Jung 2007)]
MTDERLRYLLGKYLDQTATPEELKEYNGWYQQTYSQGADMEPELTPAEMNSIYNNIYRKVRKPRIYRIGYWIAAAIFTGLAATAAFFFLEQSTPAARPVAAVSPVVPSNIVINNTHAAPKGVRLPDGSQAILYAQSTLRFDTGFGKDHRAVYLEGKGFFNVAKNATLAFTVYNHDLSVTALGTTFTITGNRNSDNVNVELHTGKVVVKQVRAKMKDVYLLPGQQLVYNVARSNAVTSGPATKTAVAQRAEKPVSYGSRTGFTASFESQPLDSVLMTIAKGYHVQINIKNGLPSDVVYTGQIREVDSLGKVLSRIAILHNLVIKATAKGYSIEKNQ